MVSSCQNMLADELTIEFVYFNAPGLGTWELILEDVLPVG